jgi:hypothetical protein
MNGSEPCYGLTPFRLMHWTAGFRFCYMLDIAGPPPVMSIVRSHCTL